MPLAPAPYAAPAGMKQAHAVPAQPPPVGVPPAPVAPVHHAPTKLLPAHAAPVQPPHATPAPPVVPGAVGASTYRASAPSTADGSATSTGGTDDVGGAGGATKSAGGTGTHGGARYSGARGPNDAGGHAKGASGTNIEGTYRVSAVGAYGDARGSPGVEGAEGAGAWSAASHRGGTSGTFDDVKGAVSAARGVVGTSDGPGDASMQKARGLRTPAAVQAHPVAGGVTAACHPNVSVLLQTAMAARRREAAEGEHSAMSAPVSADAGGAAGGETGLGQSGGAEARRERDGREAGGPVREEPAVQASGMGTSQEGLVMGAARAAAMGAAEWMWGWRDWWVVLPAEPCPGGLEYNVDFPTGINLARLPANLGAWLDAAGREAADERPLAPFPPRQESAPAAAVTGDSEGTVDVATKEVEE